MRLGVTPPVEMAGVAAAVDLSVRAEELGYTDVFSSEVGSADAFSPLAGVAARTSRIRLGTALVPVYTRPPALVAMTAASMQALSGGRFALGIGTSTPHIVERWMGMRFTDPVTRVREYVESIRRILAGEKVTFEGEQVRIDGFRHQAEPVPSVPIHVGALGPRMCRLAGAIADGVQFAFLTPDGVRSALEEVRAGMREAERTTEDFDVVIRIPIAVDEPDPVRELARRYVTGYAAVPTYAAALRRQGLGDAAAPSVEEWRAGDRARAVSLLPDEVVDAFFVRGTPPECRAWLNEYAGAGVRTAVLMHLSIGATPEQRAERIAAQLEALAPTPPAEHEHA
jgi:probable F420-dependent oxidoreductase